ncbi:hypothetical protein [Peptostreptococcus equinus]|uniref:DUF2187 domain-containing protein n=1 Tax=Peptostreptococcus equinus TaxID=3003601 RepID=A0ABY7JR94_9FIRM|nr:hypothetical protein [Peptostreptococcus sp. CBA3647]WAW14462.1 hypothetical protein O0R46_07625 [Peptostreptococcus sp. CBA3647]
MENNNYRVGDLVTILTTGEKAKIKQIQMTSTSYKYYLEGMENPFKEEEIAKEE